MFEIRLDDRGVNEDAEKEEEERREEEEEEEEKVGDGRQKMEVPCLLSLILSLTPRTGSGPSEPDSELPGGRGVEAQGLVGGEEGVEPEDSSDSAGRTRQNGCQLRLQHGGGG